MNHEPPPPTDIPDLQRALHHPNPNTRRAVSSAIDELIRLRAELTERTAERDDAREMYCREAARHSVCRRSIMDARTIAKMNGWNCFDAKEAKS